MGEILGPAIVLLIIIVALVWWMQNSRSSTKQRRDLLKAPAVLLPDGEAPDVLLANATTNYILAQRSVRVLDRLLALPTAGFSDTDRKEAQAIVNAFYSH